MYIVLGVYTDYEVYEQKIFGYNDDYSICEDYVRYLKDRQGELSRVRELKRSLQPEYKEIPKQEKYEKLKDYEKRIQPLKDHNHLLRQKYIKMSQELDKEYGKFVEICGEDKYHIEYYDFKIQEINKIEIGGTD